MTLNKLLKFSCFAVLFCAAPALATNVLVNPGFESGLLTPWTNSSDLCLGCTWSVDSTDAHSGAYSAVVDGNRLILQSFSPIPVSSITKVSFWARHPDTITGSQIAAYFEYSDATREFIVETTSSNWTFFDVLAELDSGKNLTAFGIYGNTQTSARFDDAIVNAVIPEPSTLVLLCIGMGIPILRRRS